MYSGEYMETTGVFVYDSKTGRTHTVTSRAFTTSNGSLQRGYAFSLSPDETDLLIHDLENDRIVVGELSGYEWSNETTVLDGYKLYAVVGLLADWGSDAESVYIRLAYDDGGSQDGVVEKILRVER